MSSHNQWQISHIPLASNTCPDLCVPSGRVKLTISLYLGNLTCDFIRTYSTTPILIFIQAHILQNNQRTIDTADSIVPDSRRNAVRRRLSWISHCSDFVWGLFDLCERECEMVLQLTRSSSDIMLGDCVDDELVCLRGWRA